MTKVFGFAGWSGAGKTTLIRQVIARLVGQGLRVATIKHAHHDFDIDQPGKDSWEHRQAGAAEVLVVSDRRWALMHELRGAAEPSLPELIGKLAPADLVLVEGFKRIAFPKMEVFRAANGKAPLHPEDGSIVAIASDTPFPDSGRPVLPLDDVAVISTFAERHAQRL
ncbi:molybdopterin-guanine dinucleotide biosynthesis protein B [Acidisoma silvae]|uniref:molybdopterin-guanine dinucleotide biosynthesis protein B n=1 Tax=Acidisoma silvae TaxID=2802396 RepID=UPI001D0BC276|nr:molybdopterin-guanine dinucleotide biosynthesis protein B [Acidisoma silvae]